MPASRLSAIVIAKDEERNMAGCLESLEFADEIVVVVDAESRDQTATVAKRYTDRVFIEPWLGYSEAKRTAHERASGDWILWIDADERVSPECEAEIKQAISSDPPYSGYRIRRKAFFLGKWIKHGGWYPGWVVRLFRTDRGRFNTAKVHEGLEITGTIGKLDGSLMHYTDDSLEHYLHKFNVYTSLAAQELFEQKKTFLLSDILFRPFHMFIKMYVFKLGFLDGMEGLILAALSGDYVFMKYAKLWELYFKTKIHSSREGTIFMSIKEHSK
jgi:glycosyltransferase involved in cell wall biosynthesis